MQHKKLDVTKWAGWVRVGLGNQLDSGKNVILKRLEIDWPLYWTFVKYSYAHKFIYLYLKKALYKVISNQINYKKIKKKLSNKQIK